jgi:hypothetical protein
LVVLEQKPKCGSSASLTSSMVDGQRLGGAEDGFSNKLFWVRRSFHPQRLPPRVRGRPFVFGGEPYSPSWLWYGLAASSSLPPLLLFRAPGVMVATSKGVCRVAMLQRWHQSSLEASCWSP